MDDDRLSHGLAEEQGGVEEDDDRGAGRPGVDTERGSRFLAVLTLSSLDCLAVLGSGVCQVSHAGIGPAPSAAT